MQLFSEIRNSDYLEARFSSMVKAFEGREKLDRMICVLDVGISIEQLARIHDNLVSSTRIVWFFVSNEKQYLRGTIVHFVDQKIDHLKKRVCESNGFKARAIDSLPFARVVTKMSLSHASWTRSRRCTLVKETIDRFETRQRQINGLFRKI